MKRPDKMTVGELIAKLQTFDPALPVMVDGYEGGVDYPRIAEEVNSVVLNQQTDWFYGRHEEGGSLNGTMTTAVLIRR